LKKFGALVVAPLVGVIAIALPIAAALHLAGKQSLDIEKEQAQLLAGEVLRRARTITDSAEAGIKTLNHAAPGGSCAPESIALMRDLDLQSPYLQAFGHIADGRLMCSSFGRHGDGIPIGPVTYVTTVGAEVRLGVSLPFAPNAKLIVAGRGAYAAILLPNLTTDIYTGRENISMGVFAHSTSRVLAQQGKFDPTWLRRIEPGQSLAFSDGVHVVALLRSPVNDFIAYAATPAVYLDQRVREFTYILAPLGLILGILLAAALLFLARQQMSLPTVMRGALRRKEFFMEYQPVIDLQSGRCVGAEALIRWRRPDGTAMLPDLFIPVAEDSGMIRQITAQALELVAEDMFDLLRRHPDFKVGVNLSSDDLQSSETAPLLRKFLRAARIRPENVVIEATERGMLAPGSAVGVIRELRALGLRIAIDDFGTGYSSLSYLTTLEVDYIKIDKTFVEAVDTAAATSHVAQHIIEMAKSLKLAITAEGVETPSQAAFLRERGVQFAQGWLFGKPMPIQQLSAWLASDANPASPAGRN
jgi:sensor c-di-GMP phosphodiesterase-like protein